MALLHLTKRDFRNVDRAVTENIAQQPTALSAADPPCRNERGEAPRAMTNHEAAGPSGVLPDFLMLKLVMKTLDILNHFHSMMTAVSTSSKVRQEERKDFTEQRMEPAAETTGAYSLWHVLARFSSESLPTS